MLIFTTIHTRCSYFHYMPQSLKVLPKNTKDQVISICQEAWYEKGSKRGQSTHFSAGENCKKPAAGLPLPTPCDSTHNQDFLTDTHSYGIKTKNPALLCEEKIYTGILQAEPVLC